MMQHTEHKQTRCASSQSCSVVYLSLSLMLAVFLLHIYWKSMLRARAPLQTQIIWQMESSSASSESIWWHFVCNDWFQTGAAFVLRDVTASTITRAWYLAVFHFHESGGIMSQQQQRRRWRRQRYWNSKHFLKCQQDIFLHKTLVGHSLSVSRYF